MTPYDASPARSISPEVAAYLDGYRPTCLSAERWASCRDEVLRLVTATEPGEASDAKQTVGALCGFLAWASVTFGCVAPTDVVSDANVERWFQSLEGSKGKGTRSNLRARLRRVLRVLAGDEARMTRSERTTGPAPYSTAELTTLAAVARGSAALSTALALALVAGVVVPHAAGAAVPAPGQAREACAALALPCEWIDTIPRGDAAVFSDVLWSEARRAAERHGVNLLADRLRTTWLVHVLDACRPATDLARWYRLTRADLERALPHLPAAGDASTWIALRG